MKKHLISFLVLFLCLPVRLSAQEFFVNADIVSSFMWRGLKFGDACFQPTMGVNMGNVSFMAFGSTNLKTFGQDVDFFLTYSKDRFSIQVADYFVQDADKDYKYFSYKARSTNHIFEANVSYQLLKKYPLWLKWSTLWAGADYYKADGGRAYSSYLELSYPFSAKGFNFKAECGLTPWEGMYADGFNVVNIGLSMAKKIKITEAFAVPVSCKFIINPAADLTHIVFALSF